MSPSELFTSANAEHESFDKDIGYPTAYAGFISLPVIFDSPVCTRRVKTKYI